MIPRRTALRLGVAVSAVALSGRGTARAADALSIGPDAVTIDNLVVARTIRTQSLSVAGDATLQKTLTVAGADSAKSLRVSPITAGANMLDVQAAARTKLEVPESNAGTPKWAGDHPTGLALYVTADSNDAGGLVEFRHSNGTQGIGFGYNTIYATGPHPNQPLRLKARGTGRVEVVQEGWHRVGAGHFKNDWGELWNDDLDFAAPEYFKDSLGIVHLRGCINGGNPSEDDSKGTMFTLPEGYRPEYRTAYSVWAGT